jgi:uncharacterized protein
MFAGIPYPELVVLAGGLLIAGAITGVLAGVFGVGGGAVIVPVLYELFRVLGVPDEIRLPLCIGTSLAIIIPTSIQSFRAHRGCLPFKKLHFSARSLVDLLSEGRANVRVS